ncbi:MAG TPA: lipoyl domain-containing protein [Salinivirgaceae bacterium]|nr:lipoyl domain-containing protein [Salinivirgaceae bacterium]
MIIEVKIPSPGESISTVEVARWLVADGAMVEKDQEIAEIESEKATLMIVAPDAGIIKILISEGNEVAVGTVICNINTDQTVSTITLDSSKIDNPKQSQKNDTQISSGEKASLP